MTGGLQRRVALDTVGPVINVTPLVDVVLVLLIIFMVVAPHLQQDVSLELPGIFNSDPDTPGEPFKVSVQRPGEFHYEGQRYDLEGMIAILEAAHTSDPLRRLVLRADAALRYADIRSFQDRIREIGFPGMSFMVNERHRREGSVFGGVGPGAAPTGPTDAPGGAPTESTAPGAAAAVPPSPFSPSEVPADQAPAAVAPPGAAAGGAQPWE